MSPALMCRCTCCPVVWWRAPHCAAQVVVHNLPWTCTWQQLKDAFTDAGVSNVERADVIIDSAGRSRCRPRGPTLSSITSLR